VSGARHRSARLWAKRHGKVNQGAGKSRAFRTVRFRAKIANISASWDKHPMTERDRRGPADGKPFKGRFAKGKFNNGTRDRPRGGDGSRIHDGHKPAARDRARASDGLVILYGWHTVIAALSNPDRTIRKLFLTENAARRLADENIDTGIVPEIVRPNDIDRRLGPDAVHQGLLAEADALASPDIGDLPQEGIVLVLDQITDPHNVGAILRSAAAFGVKAIVTTARHSPEATGVLAKSASGALELVPIVIVQNLARALNDMNDAGFMTVGLDSEGSDNLSAVDLQAPLALVLGAEGKGLRQLTRDTCRVVARMDMPGEIKSLNVSNAAALALYIGASKLGLMG
jgi:23S rRNA (guanosine2251-2'-O)-methyltransferase